MKPEPSKLRVDEDPGEEEEEAPGGIAPVNTRMIAAVIDIAGDFALALHVGDPVPTINFRTDYLRPAMKTALTATARVRQAGRSVGVVDIDVTNEQGKLVAVGRGCYSTKVG